MRFKCHNSNTKHFIVLGLAEGQVGFVQDLTKWSHNNNNYKQIAVEQHSSTDVHFLFKPSAIGVADHVAELHFTSKQVHVPELCSSYQHVYTILLS